MLETLKSSGVIPGRIKVEVHIEQTEFSEKNKTLSRLFPVVFGLFGHINASQFTPIQFIGWAHLTSETFKSFVNDCV